jgi:uncharacterized protein YjbI with pentapeptide repeats
MTRRPGRSRPPALRAVEAGLRRPAVWILLVVLLLMLAIWPIPVLLAPGIPNKVDRYKAMADIRTGVVQALAALGAAGGLAYTAGTFKLGIADRLIGRFEKAATQLGDANETVRQAGLLAMAQLADEWRAQRQSCIDVICAHARLSSGPATSATSRQAAMRIIVEHLRDDARVSWAGYRFDLSRMGLMDADFSDLVLAGGALSFDGAKFEAGAGKISFAGTTFAGAKVSFRGATIGNGCHLDFDGAVFGSGTVCFDNAHLAAGKVTFDGATLEAGCDVTFAHAEVNGEATLSFSNATVAGPGLRFTHANFENVRGGADGRVTFKAATFSGPIMFDDARLDRDIDMTGVTWNGATLCLDSASLEGGSLSLARARGTGGTISLQRATVGTARIMLADVRDQCFRYVGEKDPAIFFGRGPWPSLLPRPTAVGHQEVSTSTVQPPAR